MNPNSRNQTLAAQARRLAKSIGLFFGAIILAGSAVAQGREDASRDIFSKDAIHEMMLKANAYQKAHPVMGEDDRNWERATWYTGVMEAFRATGDEGLLRQTLKWGEQHGWQVGTEKHGANRLFCVEIWLDLYGITRDGRTLQPTFSYMAIDRPKTPGGSNPKWYDELAYADSLYGSASLVKLYNITGDPKYLKILNSFWSDLRGEIFDQDAGLFYRDKRFIGQTTERGKKIFWSRGNGWVVGGLVRVIDNLPLQDPQRANYIELFKTMMSSIARSQSADGLWSANLADEQHYPGPESSGTGFFLYGIGWGIRNGFLDRGTYEPILRKGWKGLAGCLSAEGQVRYGQQVGDRPADTKQDSTHEYVTGTFLLAASEMYRADNPSSKK